MEIAMVCIQIRFTRDRAEFESTIPETEIENHLLRYSGEDFEWKIVNRWITRR